MATKQEKAVKSAVKREKKRGILREERHVLWLLIAIIIFLLYLLLAQYNNWWPYARPKLGSAFYTNVSAIETPAKSTTDSSTSSDSSDTNSNGSSSTGSGSTGGGSNSDGSSNTGGGSTGGGNTGGGSTTPADSLVDLAANINVGDTKTEIGAQAKNLGENCAVILDAKLQTLGKQEVCTYTQGDKIITVTYLNDRVISASKSGF